LTGLYGKIIFGSIRLLLALVPGRIIVVNPELPGKINKAIA
jgi:hypothetical protein